MHQSHEAFEEPKEKDIKIWRYMDFTKYISLLESRSLFFVRADKLKDPFEGSYPRINIELRRQWFTERGFPVRAEELSVAYERVRKFFFINAWYMNDIENAAMWKLYLKTNEGVAIQSTLEHLKRSFDSNVEDTVFIGIVKYIDYDKTPLKEGNLFNPFLYKRRSFEHEHELRAITECLRKIGPDWTNVVYENGKYVPVNLETLVDQVYVSPDAPKWFGDLVKAVTQKYKLQKSVLASDLANRPLY